MAGCQIKIMLDQILKIEISANTVSWYSAVVATISFLAIFVLALLNYLRDRARVEIGLQKNMWVVSAGSVYPYDPDKDYLAITTINHGRRPVTIETIGYEFLGRKKGGAIIINTIPPLPYEITEGKNLRILSDQSEIPWPKVRCFIVIDATGRKYTKNIANIFKRGWYRFFNYK